MAAKVAWLARHRAELTEMRGRARRAEIFWSWSRVFVFLGIFAAFLGLQGTPVLGMSTMAGCIILFAVLVRVHRGVRRRRELADHRLDMCDETQERLGGRCKIIRSNARPGSPKDARTAVGFFSDDGPVGELTGQERDDLDIYSQPLSIFGLLNRASSVLGSRRLRIMAEHPCLRVDRIKARQDAVRWLDEHPKERLEVMGASATLREKDEYLEKLVMALRSVKPIPWRSRSVILRLWAMVSTVIAAICVGLWFFTTLGMVAMGPVLLLLLINGSLYASMRGTLNETLRPWRLVSFAATGYYVTARQAAEDLPEETLLADIRKVMAQVADKAVLPALSRKLSWVDTGGFIHTLLNVLTFYDLHAAEAILGIACPHRNALVRGLSALAELEALCSLATWAWEQPVTCYPELSAEARIRIVGGRHPMITPEIVVPNDLDLLATQRMWLITGSNMSGKSTFIRMVGVNVLLAQMGTAAAAEEMTLSPVNLITDLRARDSLTDAESYFLAEVRQLRRMVLAEGREAPVLGLIDEPFRGTNSEEQVAASMAVVEHLLEASDFVILATHEKELTDLADGTRAANYHFREDLDHEGLVFDYRIRPGAARTRNALRVLEREGYPEALMQRAHAWLEKGMAAGKPE
jgi:hypothetical protein